MKTKRENENDTADLKQVEKSMKKVAVIIKHQFRDWDWRVDIYVVSEDAEKQDIRKYIMSKMLGHFEIIAITTAVSFDYKMPLSD